MALLCLRVTAVYSFERQDFISGPERERKANLQKQHFFFINCLYLF